MKMISDREFYSWRSTKGWRTRRQGKPVEPICPACQKPIGPSAVEHERRFHVDLWQRKAHKRGDLL